MAVVRIRRRPGHRDVPARRPDAATRESRLDADEPGCLGCLPDPVFPGTSDPSGRRGLVRVVNRTDRSGSVDIETADDSDADYEPMALTLGPGAAVQFDADDLETGNSEIGLGGIGPGSGDWRLDLSSDLAIEVLSYVRTDNDGFLTPMQYAAPAPGYRHRIAIFNPGSNANQVSQLRLENVGPGPAAVTITGVDGPRHVTRKGCRTHRSSRTHAVVDGTGTRNRQRGLRRRARRRRPASGGS